jgi:cytidylate kinase
MTKKINIAIDGYSSCGKGTLAKSLAKKLNYIFIDSGSMYRAVALHLLENDIPVSDDERVRNELKGIQLNFEFNAQSDQFEIHLNKRNVSKRIREMDVAGIVSHVAKISEVRRFLVKMQQEIGADKGVVMDGRDIGTVVFPEAELKIFMTASVEIRAERRFKELVQAGSNITLEEVIENLSSRDSIDSQRDDSPLTMNDDYQILDNSNLNQEEQLALALSWVEAVS